MNKPNKSPISWEDEEEAAFLESEKRCNEAVTYLNRLNREPVVSMFDCFKREE